MIDVNKIKESSSNHAKEVQGLGKRFFLNDLRIGKEPRIKVLRGFRGLGKTTALLQVLNENSIYFSMEHPRIQEETLYAVGEALIRQGGFKTLLIDEAQHYPKWKRDTKALYDEFPQVTIVVSGSAPLAFEHERRYELIEISPLSLREFYHLNNREIERTEAWRDVDESINFVVDNKDMHARYSDYLDGGAFPSFFSYKEKTLERVYSSIKKSIHQDAPFFAKVDGETIYGMERLLLFLASSTLGEYSLNSLSNTLGLKKDKTHSLVALLEAMNIVRVVLPSGGGAKMVRSEPKLMFYHPVMRKAICNALGTSANLGAIREELAVFCFASRGWKVNTIKGMKKQPDYVIEKGNERIVVEIGGVNKKKTQLKGFSEKTLLITDYQLMCLACF